MVEKKAATAKKTPIKGPAKATSKKMVAKGDSYACEVCGLGVTVEEIGNMVVEEDSVLLCCSQPMKKKVAGKKTVKK